MVCGLAAGGWFFNQARVLDRPLDLEPTIAVMLPEQRVLPDGTVVELRDDALIRHEFSPELRRVVLAQGTAHFQVIEDVERPFVVEAEGVEVRAVGTAFSVQVGADGIEVLVTQGRVSLAAMHDSQVAGPLLTAGEGVAVQSPVHGEFNIMVLAARPLSGIEMESRLSWRLPRIEFSGTPLVEAVRMVNRHNRQQLVLADASLHDLQISGMLRADNLPALLELLRENFGIVSADPEADVIVLRRES